LGELILDRSLAASLSVNRFLGEFSRLNSSTSRASRVHVRAMSTKTSRTRALGARSANCWQSYERFLHIAGVSTAQSPSVGYPTQNGSESKRRLPIRDKNSRLRNRFGAEEVWWNRLFRLDVVAVKGSPMNKGGQKPGLQRADRTRFPYEPRVIGGKLVMPAELQRIHRIIFDAAEVEIISDEMRAVVESLWP
jgi:hypothetical protein